MPFFFLPSLLGAISKHLAIITFPFAPHRIYLFFLLLREESDGLPLPGAAEISFHAAVVRCFGRGGILFLV